MARDSILDESLYLRIILYLYEKGEVTAKDLKENTTSKYVEKGTRLENLGVLKVDRNTDNRKRMYSLTEKGKEVGKKLSEVKELLGEEKIICSSCGAEVNGSSNYCNYCGEEL
ncbi:MAG: hypothetical protein V5A88_10310 [Candidatus Thermoplasmatota archaeon]